MKACKNVVPSFHILNNVNIRAEFAAFLRDDRANAVNCGFVARRRFGFNELFEKGS